MDRRDFLKFTGLTVLGALNLEYKAEEKHYPNQEKTDEDKILSYEPHDTSCFNAAPYLST